MSKTWKIPLPRNNRWAVCFTLRESRLIFYAFDLEKRRKSLEKYSFQAWGQREAKGGPVQSLGVFVNEDQGKSPWVLKYNDPKCWLKLIPCSSRSSPKEAATGHRAATNVRLP